MACSLAARVNSNLSGFVRSARFPYISDVTIQEIVAQYEGRILELQSALAQVRSFHALAAAGLALAVGFFFALGLYAIRGQVSFLWALLPSRWRPSPSGIY